MDTCDVCGREDPRCFTVSRQGRVGTYDTIECFAHVWAPECEHCHCRILGHPTERDGRLFCCDHCALHVQSGY